MAKPKKRIIFFADVYIGNKIFANVLCHRLEADHYIINYKDFLEIKSNFEKTTRKTVTYQGKQIIFMRNNQTESIGKIDANQNLNLLENNFTRRTFTLYNRYSATIGRTFNKYEISNFKVTTKAIYLSGYIDSIVAGISFVSDVITENTIYANVKFISNYMGLFYIAHDDLSKIVDHNKKKIAKTVTTKKITFKLLEIGTNELKAIAKIKIENMKMSYDLSHFQFYKESALDVENLFPDEISSKLNYTRKRAYFTDNITDKTADRKKVLIEDKHFTTATIVYGDNQQDTKVKTNNKSKVEVLETQPIPVQTDTTNRPNIHSDSEQEVTSVHRVETTVNIAVRNQTIVNQIKKLYKNQCQLCGERVEVGLGEYMSEAHHIKPLGKIHNGPDILSNLIVLCPNHHAMFDRGSLSINLNNKRILHINKNHPLNNREMKILHNIDSEYVDYHHIHIYQGSQNRNKNINNQNNNIETVIIPDVNTVYYSDVVTLKDMQNNDTFDVQLEASYNKSFMRPLANELLHKKLNDTIKFNNFSYRIMKIKKGSSRLPQQGVSEV